MLKQIFFAGISFLGLFVHSQVFAQTATVITLDEVILKGLNYNKTLKISHYKTDVQKARYYEIRSSIYPQLNLSASYTRLSNVNEPLIHIPGQEGGFSFPSLVNNYYSRISLAQPIFAGFRLKAATELFRDNILASQVDSQIDSLVVVIDLVTLYINLYKAQLNLDVNRNNILQIDQHLKEVSDFEKAGMALKNDVLKVQLEKSNAQQSLLDAENAVKMASFNLSLQLGMPPENVIQTDTAALVQPLEIKSYDYYLEEALRSRPELKASDLRADAAVKNIKISRGNYYPSVNFTANGYYANPNIRVIPSEQKWVGTWDAGIGIAWDITGLFTNKYKIEEANTNLLQLQTLHDQESDAIKAEVYHNYLTAISATRKIELSQQALQEAVLNYATENNRYLNQLILLSDLTDANVALLSARLNAVNTKADAVLAYYRLLKSTGNLNYK
ncbi:MAG: TolC family protein [Chitinophagales bacterium]|nr:TolC family protein [Chitinophagales bacterium]